MRVINTNNNINLLKIILSLFIVSGHLFPELYNGQPESYVYCFIRGLARLSVPLFLIITGYYIRSKTNEFGYILIRIKKLFFIFIVWQIIYFKIELDSYQLGQISSKSFFLDMLYGIGHLWYLSSVILSLFLIYFTSCCSNKVKFIMSFVLLIISYFLQINNHLKFIDSKFLDEFYFYIGTYRNFLFYAFPYLLLGTNYDYWKKYCIKNIYLGYLIFFIFLIVELAVYYYFKSPVYNLFIVSFPFSLFSFNHIVNIKKQVKFNFPETLSLGIYLIHFYVLYLFYTKINIMNSFSYFYLYIFLVILTVIIWFILDKINKKIKIFF